MPTRAGTHVRRPSEGSFTPTSVVLLQRKAMAAGKLLVHVRPKYCQEYGHSEAWDGVVTVAARKIHRPAES
ncbi:unnamed protein product [Linum trigynum]|uniref:Uncharacterized protein n=1 Tax=Linum trigynum TaxID=586398 RepID=A0AAV2DT53_9ROSI